MGERSEKLTLTRWSWTYDMSGYGPFCEGCGERFYPDCDVSSVSTMEEFERHMADRHGLYPVDASGRPLRPGGVVPDPSRSQVVVLTPEDFPLTEMPTDACCGPGPHRGGHGFCECECHDNPPDTGRPTEVDPCSYGHHERATAEGPCMLCGALRHTPASGRSAT